MSAQDRAIQKLARELAGIKKEVVSWRGPQADYTSIENGGNFTFKDSDGNVTGIFGGQDDGSTTVRHVDGPTPMVPAGLTAHVDGPIIQTEWDGTFEDNATPTFDHSHLEVEATGPGGEKLRGSLNDITGGVVAFTATVSGEWTIVARSVSRAEKRSLDGDAGTVEVEIVGLSGAIEDAIGSANGKNTVHYSETPPTPEDEGIDGDTWFVNSVDTETQIMLITEQWQFLDGAWVQTELDHEVIATIDAGKITVGELDGVRITAKTVRGEQLSGDAIDGKVITGGTYRTTGGSGSWSDDGLFIARPDGTSMVRFPTDGSPLSLTASDVQIDRASIGDLDLSHGSVRSGGQVTLASGVAPPASPPELTTGWQKVCTLGAFGGRGYPPHAWESLGYWSAGKAWVRSVNIFGSSSSEPDKVEIFDYETGSFIRSFNIELNPTNNLTVIGDIVYLFGDVYSSSSVKSTWVYGYNLNTGVRTSRHEYTRGVRAKNALGNDGTNLIIASIFDNELWVHRRNPVTGVQVGSDMRSGANSWGGGTDLFGVSISGSEVTVLPRQTARVYTLSGTTLTRKTDTSNASGFAGWDNPSRNGAGMVWVDSRPFVVDGVGSVYRGSGVASDTNLEFCFTWFDGENETTPSPLATTVLPSQTTPTVSLPVRSGMQKRVYQHYVDHGLWVRITLPEDQTVLGELTAEASSPPPTTNTFPAATPAELRSGIGNFQVKGDGSGTWGPLTFNADGTMSSSAVPAWIPITSFLNGWAVGSFGFAPAYRVWPDGKVEWRGVVKGSAASTGTPIINIPVNARPSQYVPLGGACNGGGGNPGWTRIDVNDPDAVNMIRLNPQAGSVTWASLDTISYYKN